MQKWPRGFGGVELGISACSYTHWALAWFTVAWQVWMKLRGQDFTLWEAPLELIVIPAWQT